MRHLAIPAVFLLLSYSLLGQESQEIPPEEPVPETENVVYPRGDDRSADSSDVQPINGMFEDDGSVVGMAITFLGYLIILVGFLVAAWFLFKRGVFRKPFSKVEGKLEIKESKMLGNRQFLMVVEYEDNKILLGVGPGKIDYLTSLNTYRDEGFELEQNVQEKIQGGR
ncbi:flagellar biosynthetic protein FliO [Puniceicoccaceae bacterium K14]|nr:flagellar biosynthetic protein FliO [Puniceicoccaceae bacterium K14]